MLFLDLHFSLNYRHQNFMDQDNAETNVPATPATAEWNPLTPPPTATTDSNNNNHDSSAINRTTVSTLVSFSSWSSSISVDSRTAEEKATDGLFDQIEDLISDYMRESQRHHFDCRILRCHTGEAKPRFFNAVVVINPPSSES